MQKTLYNIKNNIDFPGLKTSIREAKAIICRQKISFLPILNNHHFVGNLSADDIQSLPENDLVESHLDILTSFFLDENFSLIEAIEVMLKNESDIVPIINAQRLFLGYLTRDEVLEQLSEMPFIREEGSMLVVEKNLYDYSFSQIAQIVESNGGKMLGIIASQINGNDIRITIKIVGTNINEIIQSFRRYNYEVVSEHREDKFLTELKDRSAYLDKYLNI